MEEPEIIAEFQGEVKAQAAEGIPMKRMGTLAELSNTVLFLASDEASFITAEDTIVSGGQGLLVG